MTDARETGFARVLETSVPPRSALAVFLERHRFLLAFASLSSLMGISVGVAKVTTSLYAVELGASATELGLAGLNALVSPAGAVLGNLAGGVVGRAFGAQSMFLVFAALFVAASLVLATGAPLSAVAND